MVGCDWRLGTDSMCMDHRITADSRLSTPIDTIAWLHFRANIGRKRFSLNHLPASDSKNFGLNQVYIPADNTPQMSRGVDDHGCVQDANSAALAERMQRPAE